jgi:hypothetical protein
VTCCGCSVQGLAAATSRARGGGGRAVLPGQPDAGVSARTGPPAQATAAPTGPDCVGPVLIPRQLTQVLHVLATAAAVDDFVPLWICATELVRRWSSDRGPVCARVIRDPCEAIAAPPAGPVDQSMSFRTALRQAAGSPAGSAQAAGPVDVAILVSPDGGRLYIERMTSAADGPDPQQWAGSFLQLLRALADMPDAPVSLR